MNFMAINQWVIISLIFYSKTHCFIKYHRQGQIMPFARNETIEKLMDQVEGEAQALEVRRRKSLSSPTARFNFETPLAEVKMFGWDVARLFSDPSYYVECILRRKLWRWKNFPDDDEPISMELDAWLSH
jgi:hypothetical protein